MDKNIQLEKSFRSYLFRIAENEVYDLYRKAARDKKLQAHLIKRSIQAYSHIEEDVQSKEDSKKLTRLLNYCLLKEKKFISFASWKIKAIKK